MFILFLLNILFTFLILNAIYEYIRYLVQTNAFVIYSYNEEFTDTSLNDTNATNANNANEYDDYGDNIYVLATKNAGNIEYIKKRLDDYDDQNKKLQQFMFDVSNNLINLNSQVGALVEQQSQYASQIATPQTQSDLNNIDLTT